MATKKISELEAITEADDSDVLAIVDVSEGKTNKITKNNLLIGAGHSIEMSLNQETYALTLALKNAAGTELSTASIDLPNENSITNISYNNGKLTLTKQSGTTTEVDITGLINGLATETALTNLANALKETIGIQTNTYDNTKTYNTGDIVVQNEKIYKANQDNITGTFDNTKWDEISLYEYQKIQDEAIEENYKVITKLQEDVEDLTERVEDAEKNQLTNTPTPATSHYLQDSADARFRRFIPIGRTTQESTTGKQLFDANAIGHSAIVVSDDGKTIKMPVASSGNGGVETGKTLQQLCPTLQVGDTVYLYFDRNLGNTSNGIIYLVGSIGEWGMNTAKTITQEMLDSKVILYGNRYSTGETGQCILIDFRIVKNSTDQWERYTGGEPAPNPKYPFPIKNTGDNGSVNEKIENKNFISLKNINESWSKVVYKGQEDETLLCNGTKSGAGYAKFTATKRYFKAGTYTCNSNLISGSITRNGSNYNALIYICKLSTDSIVGNSIGNVGRNSKVSFTIAEDGEYYIRFAIWDDGVIFDNAVVTVQIEQGSTATSYVPHSEQNPSFPLAEGQKFYEGSHPDDDEKVHHKWGGKVLDGTEPWKKSVYFDGSYYFYPKDIGWNYKEYGQLKCSHAVFARNGREYKVGTCLSDSSIGLWLLPVEQLPTTEDFKAYLAEQYANGTPVIVAFELAEETTEDFTEEQKTAWQQIKSLRTYKNVTHISSEDETPANLEVEYVQDTKTYIDNKVTALTNAIISLGGNI